VWTQIQIKRGHMAKIRDDDMVIDHLGMSPRFLPLRFLPL